MVVQSDTKLAHVGLQSMSISYTGSQFTLTVELFINRVVYFHMLFKCTQLCILLVIKGFSEKINCLLKCAHCSCFKFRDSC